MKGTELSKEQKAERKLEGKIRGGILTLQSPHTTDNVTRHTRRMLEQTVRQAGNKDRFEKEFGYTLPKRKSSKKVGSSNKGQKPKKRAFH